MRCRRADLAAADAARGRVCGAPVRRARLPRRGPQRRALPGAPRPPTLPYPAGHAGPRLQNAHTAHVDFGVLPHALPVQSAGRGPLKRRAREPPGCARMGPPARDGRLTGGRGAAGAVRAPAARAHAGHRLGAHHAARAHHGALQPPVGGGRRGGRALKVTCRARALGSCMSGTSGRWSA